MSNVIERIPLKYLKRSKLEEFKNIRNISVQFDIRHLFFRRFTVDKFNSLEDLKKQSYHMYGETINIDYLNIKEGKEFLNRLSKVTINDAEEIAGNS